MHPQRRPNLDRSPEVLEGRLRALPQPPVPAELEARLLATIPPPTSIPQRRWPVRVALTGLVGPLAAASLLPVLAWTWGNGKNRILTPPTAESASHKTPRPPDDSASGGGG